MRGRPILSLSVGASLLVGFLVGHWTATTAGAGQRRIKVIELEPLRASRPPLAATKEAAVSPSAGGVGNSTATTVRSYPASVVRALRADGVVVSVQVLDGASQTPKLGAGFVALFGLTPAEETTLNQAMASAAEEIKKIEVTSSDAHFDPATGSWTIHTPPFPQAGGPIHDQVFTAFTSTLGEERMTDLNSLSPHLFDNMLSAFGAEEQTVVVSPDPENSKPTSPMFKVSTVVKSTGLGFTNSSNGQLLGSDVFKQMPLTSSFIPPEYLK